MSHDTKEINLHVKDISARKFTVFITEPMEMESVVEPLPYRLGQDMRVAYEKDNRFVLYPWGYWLAKKALDALRLKAAFIDARHDEFKGFLETYQAEYDKLSGLIREARLLTKTARDAANWREQPTLLRRQMALEKDLASLYKRMYTEQFGKDSVFLCEDELREQI